MYVFVFKTIIVPDIFILLPKYVIRHQDSLIPTLTAQQKETFEKLKDCEAELHGMNEREAFISGFKLAARIMTEVLYEPSED